MDSYGYLFLCLFSCKLRTLWILLFNKLWVLHWINCWWCCWFCIVVLKDINQGGGAWIGDKRTKNSMELNTLNLVIVHCGCWLFIRVLLVFFFSVDYFFNWWGKMPLNWKLYDLEKLMKFYHVMNFDKGSRGSETIYRSSNQGCDEKP